MSSPRVYVHISPAMATYVQRSAPVATSVVPTPPVTPPARDSYTVRPLYTGDGFTFTPHRQGAELASTSSSQIKEFFSWLFGS